jgi:hypothetical protein
MAISIKSPFRARMAPEDGYFDEVSPLRERMAPEDGFFGESVTATHEDGTRGWNFR